MSGFIKGEDRYQATLFPERLDDYIAEDSAEFLETDRIRGILNTYCKFMPVEIIFGTRSKWVDDPSGETNEDGTAKQVQIEVPKKVSPEQQALLEQFDDHEVQKQGPASANAKRKGIFEKVKDIFHH